jgi:pimeloyl-ACP methyl ester carboxylesterase
MYLDTSIGKNFVRIYVENVVIFCHGLPYERGSIIEKGYDQLAKFFAYAGKDSVVFDFSVTGLSKGDFSIISWVDDLLNLLPNFSSVDLIGFSMGGVAAVYAAFLENVRSLVVVATPCCSDSITDEVIREIYLNAKLKDTLRGIGSFDSFAARLKKEMDEFEPVKWMGRIRKPVLIVHGTSDDIVSYKNAEVLFEKAREPKYLLRVINGNHFLRNEMRVTEYILTWLKKKEKGGKVIEELQL